MSILNYYTHVIVLKRSAPKQDNMGGQSDKNDELGTYLARPENLSSVETEYAKQDQAQVFDRIFTTPDCQAKELDILELREKDTNALVDTYEVRRVQPMRQVQRLHHLELDVLVYK